jgi:hypothetical protein
MKAHGGPVYNGFDQHGCAAGLLAAVLLLCAVSCDADIKYLEPVTDSAFQPGQVWAYRTRPGEEGSRIIVGAIDRVPKEGRVVHITVTRIRLRTANVPGGYANQISHLAIGESFLLESIREQVDTTGIDPGDFEGGYENWLDAYEAGSLFVQKVPLAEALDRIEASQNP